MTDYKICDAIVGWDEVEDQPDEIKPVFCFEVTAILIDTIEELAHSAGVDPVLAQNALDRLTRCKHTSGHIALPSTSAGFYPATTTLGYLQSLYNPEQRATD